MIFTVLHSLHNIFPLNLAMWRAHERNIPVYGLLVDEHYKLRDTVATVLTNQWTEVFNNEEEFRLSLATIILLIKWRDHGRDIPRYGLLLDEQYQLDETVATVFTNQWKGECYDMARCIGYCCLPP